MPYGGSSGSGGSSSTGAEVAFAQITAQVSVTATTEGTADTCITATAFTADGTSTFLIETYSAQCRPDTAAIGRILSLWLYEDGSSIGQMATMQSQAANAMITPIYAAVRRVPASGSRTYSIRASVNAGTGIFGAGLGGTGNVMPAFVRITRAL